MISRLLPRHPRNGITSPNRSASPVLVTHDISTLRRDNYFVERSVRYCRYCFRPRDGATEGTGAPRPHSQPEAMPGFGSFCRARASPISPQKYTLQ